ncbi:hypothetical protein ACOSQ2_031858 [Xanthoceras sorbifolium]
MLTDRLHNVEEAYQLALQLERQSSSRRFPYNESGNFRFPTSTNSKLSTETSKRGTVGDGKGKTKAFGEGPQCYKCKRFRHFAVVCPIRNQRIAFVYEKDLMFQEEEKPNKNNNWKRTNIFHTRVEHGDKALNVIIDNISSMNIVAKEVVEWLGLPQEAHPMPYRVSGINDNNSVPVKNNCFVKFSLGKKYTNKVWYDVLPMTVYHLLLGSPWMFDRRVNYDRLENTYSFKFQNQKLVLEPLTITEFDTPKKRDKQFEVRAQVMIRLRPECFPSGSYSKLHALWAGPFQILKKLGPNAYVVDLPPTYTISPIFNVEDLTEFQWEVVSSNPLPDTPIKIPSIPRQPNNVATILDHQFSNKPMSESVWLQSDEINRLNADLFHAYLQQNLPEAKLTPSSSTLSSTDLPLRYFKQRIFSSFNFFKKYILINKNLNFFF